MRYSQLPDVPTVVAEFYPGFDATAWAAFAVPHGTLRGIVDKLAAELNKSQLDPAMREKLIQSGVEPTPNSTPAAARAYARAKFEKWGASSARPRLRWYRTCVAWRCSTNRACHLLTICGVTR